MTPFLLKSTSQSCGYDELILSKCKFNKTVIKILVLITVYD